MIMFKLKEATIKVRDQDVTVRELTQSERTRFVKEASEDRYRAPALIASLGLVNPKMTEEEVGQQPAEVIEEIVSEIMILSGLKKRDEEKDKEVPDQKESDAG